MTSFKYRSEMSKCSGPCPDLGRYRPSERAGFRWIRDPATGEDFLPVAVLSGRPRGCGSYALSFFTSLESARARWKSLDERLDAANRFGTHVARLQLMATDGVSCDADVGGHFDLHEYAEVALDTRDRSVVPVLESKSHDLEARYEVVVEKLVAAEGGTVRDV